jgi:hypothetical protein
MTILAQVTGGRSIIEDSIQQVQNVQQAWDKRWLDIFNGANGLYLGINKFAAVILVGDRTWHSSGDAQCNLGARDFHPAVQQWQNARNPNSQHSQYYQ